MNYDKKLELVKNEVLQKIEHFERSGRKLTPSRIAFELCNDHAHEISPGHIFKTWTYCYVRGLADELIKIRQN